MGAVFCFSQYSFMTLLLIALAFCLRCFNSMSATTPLKSPLAFLFLICLMVSGFRLLVADQQDLQREEMTDIGLRTESLRNNAALCLLVNRLLNSDFGLDSPHIVQTFCTTSLSFDILHLFFGHPKNRNGYLLIVGGHTDSHRETLTV